MQSTVYHIKVITIKYQYLLHIIGVWCVRNTAETLCFDLETMEGRELRFNKSKVAVLLQYYLENCGILKFRLNNLSNDIMGLCNLLLGAGKPLLGPNNRPCVKEIQQKCGNTTNHLYCTGHGSRSCVLHFSDRLTLEIALAKNIILVTRFVQTRSFPLRICTKGSVLLLVPDMSN